MRKFMKMMLVVSVVIPLSFVLTACGGGGGGGGGIPEGRAPTAHEVLQLETFLTAFEANLESANPNFQIVRTSDQREVIAFTVRETVTQVGDTIHIYEDVNAGAFGRYGWEELRILQGNGDLRVYDRDRETASWAGVQWYYQVWENHGPMDAWEALDIIEMLEALMDEGILWDGGPQDRTTISMIGNMSVSNHGNTLIISVRIDDIYDGETWTVVYDWVITLGGQTVPNAPMNAIPRVWDLG